MYSSELLSMEQSSKYFERISTGQILKLNFATFTQHSSL